MLLRWVCCRKALIKAHIGGPALLAPVVQAARDLVEQLSLVRCSCWELPGSCNHIPGLCEGP